MTEDRVLIVDDDPALLDALPAALKLRFPELTVDVARSGPQALGLILATDYDAIVCDIKMPGMDGLALLAEIRERGSQTPTLLITGHGEQGLALQALRSGAYDFIQKPIEREYLIAALARAIEQRKLARLVSEQRQALESHALELEGIVESRTRELVAANRVKDEFLAMLGHELRNPIAAINNALAVLDRVRADSFQGDDMRKIIGRQVRVLSRMVDDLLDISRLTQGKLVLDRAPIDWKDIVERALESFRQTRKLESHQVSVRTTSAWVLGDTLRLEQIISNLLDNAIKFTPPGREIRLRLEAVDDRAELRIEDEGVGIPRWMLGRVFDLFFQAEQSLDRRKGGLGLGLALVKRFVEMHGGSVEAFSDGPHRGSTFVVQLPLVRSQASAQLPSSQQRPTEMRKVLLVEDNRDVRDGLRSLLELFGHEVKVAENGPEAIEVYTEFQPEAVLIDIGIPEMDGYEVARRMQTFPVSERPLLIAITGYGQPQDRARTESAGFDAHFVKPVDTDKLLDVLAQRRVPPAPGDPSSQPDSGGADSYRTTVAQSAPATSPLATGEASPGTSSERARVRPRKKDGVAPTAS